jgi:hypothetical protein
MHLSGPIPCPVTTRTTCQPRSPHIARNTADGRARQEMDQGQTAQRIDAGDKDVYQPLANESLILGCSTTMKVLHCRTCPERNSDKETH